MRKFITKRNIIILIVVLAVAGFAWNRYQASQNKAGSQEYATVERRTIQESLTVSGVVKAERSATLNFPASGKLGYITVADGDEVGRGKALAGLDQGDLQASERVQYYKYLAADANAKEVEDLVKGHDADETFAQKNARVGAQTARDSAYDAWLVARRALTNSNLFAPFAGIVTNITANAVGDTVNVTDGITVVDPSSLYFEIEIDESDLGKVELGMSTQVEFDAFVDQTFTGNLESIGFISRLSASGATVFPAKIRFASDVASQLRLGMNGDATMVLAQADNVLSLPIESVNDGVVRKEQQPDKDIPVKTGLEGDEYIEIVSGLNEGDSVLR